MGSTEAMKTISVTSRGNEAKKSKKFFEVYLSLYDRWLNKVRSCFK